MSMNKRTPNAPDRSWMPWAFAALLMAILSITALAGSGGWFDTLVGSIHMLTALILGGRAWYGYRIAALKTDS